MKKRLLLTILLLSPLVFSSSWAQRWVKGKVVDTKDGEPLIGVNVVVKGTLEGTATDFNGEFSVKLPTGKDILQFTFIGYNPREENVGNKEYLIVKLQEVQQELDEFVVIGYGEKEKKKVTGSVASIKGSELVTIAQPSFDAMLEGQLAGVNVQNFDGTPGGRAAIMIRGNAAVPKGDGDLDVSSPLYVIDGVPIISNEEDMDMARSFSDNDPGTGLNILASLNPNDIESIDILKDAASTAIYGSRGANGVILIKTKKGRAGKPRFNVNFRSGLQFMDSYRDVAAGKLERDLKMDMFYRFAPDEDYKKLPPMLVDSLNPYYNQETNWQELNYQVGREYQIDFGVSGGSQNASYYLNMSNSFIEGIKINNIYKRNTLLLKNNFTVVEDLVINTQISASRLDQTLGNYRKAGVRGDRSSSLIPPPTDRQMLSSMEYWGRVEEQNYKDSYRAVLNLSYSPIDWLVLKSDVSGQLSLGQSDISRPPYTSGTNTETKSTVSKNQSFTNDNRAIIRNSGNTGHSISLLLGQGLEIKNNAFQYINSQRKWSDKVHTVWDTPNSEVFTYTNDRSTTYLYFFGRLEYDYKAKYLLSLAMRADGSSAFGVNNKWGYFPSASVGWVLTEENFLKDNAIINFLKVRASIGKTGSPFYDAYKAFGEYRFGGPVLDGRSVIPTFLGKGLITPEFDAAENFDLTWQEEIQWDFGLDMELFNKRVSAEADFYHRESLNQIWEWPLPTSTGFKKVYKNVIGVINYGAEFSLRTKNTHPNATLQWETNFNASYNRNYISKLPDEGKDFMDGNRLLRTGYPVNNHYLFDYRGIYDNQAEIPRNPETGKPIAYYTSNNSATPGSPIFTDINGDYIIDERDRINAGDPNPKLMGGITNTFRYKNFTLSILFTYQVNRDIYANYQQNKFSGLHGNNWFNGAMPDLTKYNVWREPADGTNAWPLINPYGINYFGGDYKSTLFMEDGSYLKLQQIRLAYNIPQRLCKKIGLSNVGTYITATNLHTWQNYSGPDASAVDTYGIDNNYYPVARKILFGINANF